MDNKPTDTPNPQPRPVMDIQPPQQPSVSDITPVRQDVATAAAPSTLAPAPVEPVPSSFDSAPQAESLAPSEPETPAPLAAQPPAHKHSRMPLVAIIMAIGLAGVLGTFAFLAYTDSSKNPTTATTSQTAPVVKETVAPAEVDDTNAAVDSSLNSLDDNAEYDDNSLSDTTLGL